MTLLLGKPFISRAALSNDLTKILLSTNILTISSIELAVLTKHTHSALTYSSRDVSKKSESRLKFKSFLGEYLQTP